MGKLSRKLVVYLDQNFLSEIAKVDINPRVDEKFKRLFELLHSGFLEEKLIVPRSWAHRLESSLKPALKERLSKHQSYLGQVDLRLPDTVRLNEVTNAFAVFVGREPLVKGHDVAFADDPDRRLQQFDIRFDGGVRFDYLSSRLQEADACRRVQVKILEKEVTLAQQIEQEISAQARLVAKREAWKLQYAFGQDMVRFGSFLQDDSFRQIPCVGIYSHLWSKLFVHYPKRRIRDSDIADVDILSTYIAHVDVMATDTFMATLVRELGFHEQYGTRVFSASQADLVEFEMFLTNFLRTTEPIRRPVATVFVLPDDRIRADAWEFFRKLGVVSGSISCAEQWIEVYAFDDGEMPDYRNPRVRHIDLPFFGLQDVTPVKINKDTSRSDVLRLCHETSPTDKFVLIDEYKEFPRDFVERLAARCEQGECSILGFTVYDKGA